MPDPVPTPTEAAPAVQLPPPPEITAADMNLPLSSGAISTEVPNTDAAEAAAFAEAAARGASEANTTPAVDPKVAKTQEELTALASVFGVDPGSLEGDAAAQTLTPMIQQLIQAGQQRQASIFNAQPQTPQPAPQNQLPAVQAPPTDQAIDFAIDEADLEDAPPGVVKAIKALADRQQKAYQAAVQQAQAAEQQAQQFIQQQQQVAQQQAQQYQQQIETRASTWLDNLQSPKYGVGTNRNLMQTIAAEKVSRAAADIIRGIDAYGSNPPTIEAVMAAAVMAVDGVMPPAAVATQPTAAVLPPGAQQRSVQGTAPTIPVHSAGSAGVGNKYMSNQQYLEGARAILSR